MGTRVTPQQQKILEELATLSTPLTAGELAQRMGFDTHSCCTQLSRLRAKGLTKSVDSRWFITPEGKDTYADDYRTHMKESPPPVRDILPQIIAELAKETEAVEILFRFEFRK